MNFDNVKDFDGYMFFDASSSRVLDSAVNAIAFSHPFKMISCIAFSRPKIFFSL